MLAPRIKLFTILGFTVRLDVSWFALALMVTWASASALQGPPDNFPASTSWIMGGAIAVGLFVSIVLHELTHSIVARTHGMHMRGITLFALGGVAEMEDEPPTPWAEFGMAIVGPIASVLIGGVLGAGWRIATTLDAPDAFCKVLAQLAITNVALAIFNMMPAFPLDGGRVLRSILWAVRGEVIWATRIAGALGMAFGGLLVLAGLALLLSPIHAWGAVTWVLIGAFLLVFARVPLKRLQVKAALTDITVRSVARDQVGAVPRWAPLSDAAASAFGDGREKLAAVVDESGMVGVIVADHLRRVPREEWDRRTVGELAVQVPGWAVIGLDAPAEEAFARMARSGVPSLFVVDGSRLIGRVTFADILSYIRTHQSSGVA